MASGEITIYPKDSDVLPPARKVKWPADREHFWTNWRVSTKKTNETVCRVQSMLMANFIWEIWDRFPIFHAMLLGNMKEFEIFVKSNKSDPKQPPMSTFTISSVIAKRKQTELEKSWERCSSTRISL